MEAKEWLENPTNRDAHRFDVLFQRLCSGERIFNQEHFRHLDDGIWELKRAGHRLLCYQEGRNWRLTHHFAKKKQKCPRGEIERAKLIRAEHLQRHPRSVENDET